MTEAMCPVVERERILHLELNAVEIPHGARVTKKNGKREYSLQHQLTIWKPTLNPGTPGKTSINGTFLIGPDGDINQIGDFDVLIWCIRAGALVDYLEKRWDEEEDKRPSK